MDMEWAKDGLDGQLYIVQARPETVASQRKATSLETYVARRQRRDPHRPAAAVGEKIASGNGPRHRRTSPSWRNSSAGEVLVADMTTPTGSRS